jgi:ribosomal protein S18 acetylase RimI-like enzyme
VTDQQPTGAPGDGAIRLRPATTQDLPTIVEVWAAAWRDGHVGHVPDELLAARDTAYFTAQAARRLETTWVAIDRTDRIAGVVIIAGDELFQLAVADHARRTGVGAALLTTAERAIHADHASAWLAVAPGNTRARKFYERRGWIDDGPTTYSAPAATGQVAVPVHRYVKDRDQR